MKYYQENYLRKELKVFVPMDRNFLPFKGLNFHFFGSSCDTHIDVLLFAAINLDICYD